MELEELKDLWTSLDERLNKQEKLKDSVVRKMLLTQSDRHLTKIINYAYFGIIICLIGVGVMVWGLSQPHIGVFKTILFGLITVTLLVVIALNILELVRLYKVNFTKPVSNNIRLVQKFSILYKRQAIAIYIVATILLILGIIAGLMMPNMELWRWLAIAVAIAIGIVGSKWEYENIYRKNIDSIIKNLAELKELEDE